MPIIGACAPCGRYYQVDPAVPEQGRCPSCGRPLQLIAPDQARRYTDQSEPHPGPRTGPEAEEG